MSAEYNGGLTREQFLFYEIRIVASLLCQGYTKDETIKKIQDENLFQFPTERSVLLIAGMCFRRIEALESNTLLHLLGEAPVDVAKQVNLYAMMKYNGIVWDFMTQVIAEKFRTQEFELQKKDLNIFFIGLQEQNESIATWKESTINKIKQVLVKSLVECGYLDSTSSTKLNPVLIEPELEDEIREKGDFAALPAFNCFR